MLLSDLLRGFVDYVARQDCNILRLMLDSRQVMPGDLFIAIPGKTVDGRKYIDDAIARGAAAVIWQSDSGSEPIPIHWRTSASGEPLPMIAIDNLIHKVGVLADRFYAGPSKSLYTIGITGTNGKTSTSQFIAQALDATKHCGVIGTMGWGYLDALQAATHTTPDAITCHRQLAELRDSGAEAVAMEVSSHALDQGRVGGVHFDCAVFTNLTHDHLDYHGNMQAYADAKTRLFHWPRVRTHIINQDDAYGRELIAKHPADVDLLRYGLDKFHGIPELYAENISYHHTGMSMQLHTPYGSGELNVGLFGEFNVYNLLATMGVLLDAGLSVELALQRLQQVRPIGGRMQVMHEPGRPLVIIDYAHTPDALQQVLSSTRQHRFGKLWLVFGCGGDRDKAKRPVMGAIAESFTDHVILTNDNPRHEQPEKIIEDIRAGLRKDSDVVIEQDRARAIRHAIAHAAQQDVVVIAGKGHETYQQIGDEKLPFSDMDVVTRMFAGVTP
ncbi:MAG: UDP-N-acetylmuramoyl-L-alanyl-D-glutamate--2,6-diaminopimelate ligase [Gammaproteobacteria bacterium]|nr:UDP-N-acetylmuramoyl-L-alanyl-D-glutamate--2,6-diaminopimelate ligase [Gammaproteobacteria bacterium]